MSSRRYVRGWGALSFAVGAVLVGTAAQPPQSGPEARPAAGPSATAVVSVDGCAAGGLCSAPRHTLAL
ncbi:hypothetical protein R6L23_14555, partial [Streptomyces sp. SR27]|nr:hypothetical protein [Streptomyces sp. SR27]